MIKQPLIFTDLDGTLLDHDTYSFVPALPTLHKLRQNGTPVIANTSKTFAELVEIRGALELDTPFIVENGSAIYIPISYFKHQPRETETRSGYWVKEFSPPIKHWLEILDSLKPDFKAKFDHFANMTIEQICQATGLSPHNAQLAATREYGEPILWLGDQKTKDLFIQAIEPLGATPLQGGRFLHLTGQSNKGQALTWLLEEYQRQYTDKQFSSIALGDGHNDIAMLEAADIAIRILSPCNPPPPLSRTNGVITSTKYGPSGWSECIEQLLFS